MLWYYLEIIWTSTIKHKALSPNEIKSEKENIASQDLSSTVGSFADYSGTKEKRESWFLK